jgi:hypothetical protein
MPVVPTTAASSLKVTAIDVLVSPVKARWVCVIAASEAAHGISAASVVAAARRCRRRRGDAAIQVRPIKLVDVLAALNCVHPAESLPSREVR